VTFLEGGKRFVSTSDDKKIFVWEFGIPVVAKHISEPDMNSIPAATLSPCGSHWAGQSMDNTIKIYDCSSGFKLNRSKVFDGHKVQGFACGVKFSPDG
jgi:pre-mRNA-processing factor 17